MVGDLGNRQQIERDYHNRKYKDDIISSSPGFVNAAYIFYQRTIDQLPCGRILDFGCGDGWVSINLAKLGYDVFGIDISIELINKARKWAKDIGVSGNVHFEEMAGEHLLFQDDFFDAVVGSAVLHHTDFEMALNSIYRVLKPGGIGLFIEPMNQNIFLKTWRAMTPWRRSPAERALTMEEINMIKKKFPLARLNYFVFFSILSIGLMTMFPNIHLMRSINKWLEKCDECLIKRFPKIGIYCAVVVVELVKD